MCPHCLATGTSVLGDELHIICHCSATMVVAYTLRMHFTSLHPVVVDLSSNDDAMIISHLSHFPPGFQPVSVPPPGNMLVPLDPAGKHMIRQHILSKWPTYGWCLGNISAWNSNLKCTVCKQIVDFTVFYPDDSSSGPHCFSLDNY